MHNQPKCTLRSLGLHHLIFVWLSVAKDARLSDDSHTTDMPSALLSVQIPHIYSNETGTIFTCSVDARWAVGIYSGGPVGDIDADCVQKVIVKNTRPFAPDLGGYRYNFPPIDDGFWRRIHMDMDWLYALTPLLGSNTSGWTSLAALLTEIGMDNSTGIITDWWDTAHARNHHCNLCRRLHVTTRVQRQRGLLVVHLQRTQRAVPAAVGQCGTESEKPSGGHVRFSPSRRHSHPTVLVRCRWRLRL